MTYDEIMKRYFITFDVTQEDIDTARFHNTNAYEYKKDDEWPSDCCGCPVEIAITRTLGLEPNSIFVPGGESGSNIKIYKGEIGLEHQEFSHSPESRALVARFDAGEAVRPVTLTINRIFF